MDDRRWRLWGAAIALCAWSGVILQLVRVAIRLDSIVGAVARLSLFFTTISNLTVAIVYTLIALRLVRFRHPLLIAGLALTMAMVGAVFELMLRAHVPMDGLKWLNNLILHDLVPLLCVAAWIALAPKGLLRSRDPWIMATFPLLYLAYALLRGAIGGLYPYPFLDPVRIGWGGVTLCVVAISAVFLLAGHGLVALDRYVSRR